MCALAYLVNTGSAKNPHMTEITKSIWSYLLNKGLTCTAEYIPSELNVEADWESRQKDSSEWRLDPKIFREICLRMGFPTIDLFASLLNHQLKPYIKLENGSRECRDKCILTGLVSDVPICLSSIQSDWKNPIQNITPSHRHDHCYASMAVTNMIPTLSRNVNKETITLTKIHNTPNEPRRGKSSIDSKQYTTTSGMASLRTKMQTEGFSDQATSLITYSRRKGTRDNYESAWKKFSIWCSQKQTDPFSCPLNIIIN